MTVALTINGQTFDYPETDDEDWGPEATDWAQAVTVGMLQKAGGLFTLLAEVDFGATYGLKSVYYKTRTSNIATAEAFRLARADSIAWRNQANDGNLLLSVNTSNLLTFNGTTVQNVLSVLDTTTIDLTLAADVLSADVVAGSIGNTQLATGINVNKLAALTVSRAVVSDGSGFLAAATTTAVEIGYVNGLTSSVQTQLDARVFKSTLAAKGDLISASAAATPVAVTVGTNGQVLSADSTQTSGLKWIAALANPMNAIGDIIVGGVAGAAARLGIGTANQLLFVNATTPGYGFLVNAMVDPAAAIAVSKLAALTASRAVVTDGSGFLAASTASAVQVGYLSNVTSDIQAQLDAKGTNPLTTTGDIIYASNTATPATQARLGIGAASTVLNVATGIPSWSLLVNANIDAAAAIVGTKISPNFGSQNVATTGVYSAGATTITTPGFFNAKNATSITGLYVESTGVSSSVIALRAKNDVSEWDLTTLGDTFYLQQTSVGAKFSMTTAGVMRLWAYTTGVLYSSSNGTISSGAPTPTIQKFTTSSGTYTTAAGVKWIRVRMVGGGGGGGPGHTSSTGGGTGGNTTFGTTLLVANGGTGGINSGVGGTGGTASLGAAIGTALSGGNGGPSYASPASGVGGGSCGAASFFGGAGAGGYAGNAGSAAAVNSGAGGGGGGVQSLSNGGSGGGAGGFVDAIIATPSATYSYAVGAAGTAGTGTYNGGLGGLGYIEVTEYYV